ncbi:MAG: hypothetical protein IJG45_06715 [Oscillospiraceae bacterium]|nr:hypothetical protein [Oscillospiraceae bacterium]
MNSKNWKAFLSTLLTAAILAACAGCADSPSPAPTETTDPTEATQEAVTTERPETFSQDEYVLYQNVFYSGYGADYDGKPTEKEGVFAVIHDAYNDRLRYYVWGYYDQTRCCDWQWEFVPQDVNALPPVGSLVTVRGTFASGEEALDGYWITDAQVETDAAYTGPAADLDMRSMGATLERVQMYNIMYHPEAFEGQTYFAYGRIASVNSIQDPYYDGSWSNTITWGGDLPAVGTLVEVTGTVEGGTLSVQSMNEI